MPCPYFNRQTFAQRFKDAFSSLFIYSIHGNFVVFFALDSILAHKKLYHAPLATIWMVQINLLRWRNIKCKM
jgi:hypothetical protein